MDYQPIVATPAEYYRDPEWAGGSYASEAVARQRWQADMQRAFNAGAMTWHRQRFAGYRLMQFLEWLHG